MFKYHNRFLKNSFKLDVWKRYTLSTKNELAGVDDFVSEMNRRARLLSAPAYPQKDTLEIRESPSGQEKSHIGCKCHHFPVSNFGIYVFTFNH